MKEPAHTPLSALDTIFLRRSVRTYEPRPIDDATVRALLDAAVQAPTAMHLEPWAFVILQNESLLRKYSDAAKALWLKGGKTHEALHVPRLGRGFGARAADSDFSVFHHAGTLIVICARAAGPFVEADCWLAAENLMLAACALGLGTCCIGSAVPVLNTPEAKTELQIPSDFTAVVPIVVGVPAGPAPEISRKDPEILFWKR
jgi:nitroreductase